MQSADFLSAVFFYLKVGENLNQNWIVENLNNAFSTWNGKLGELWGLVTTGPQTFKGGAVWSVMQTLHNGMVGIGYALVVLFFAISLCKNTMNFHELKRPEAAIHYFLRFVAAKTLVGYGMDIMLNVFSICNGIVTDMADSMGGISEAMVSLPAEMQTAIENVGFLASIPLWLVTILGSLFITVLSFGTVYAGIPADCWMQVCIVSQRMDEKAFVATSGGGKSMFVKLEILMLYLRFTKARFYVVDPENEYAPLVQELGGEVVNISVDSATHFNPLDFKYDKATKIPPHVAKAEFVLSLCEQIMGKEHILAGDKSLIDDALENIYKPLMESHYTAPCPTIKDLWMALNNQRDKRSKEIALALRIFATGSMQAFAQPTNVDMSNRLICFNIQSLGEQLKPVAMLSMLEYINTAVMSNERNDPKAATWVYFDEIYLLLRDSLSANFLYTSWKRFRKYNAYATGITQNVQDCLTNDTAYAMLANSEFVVMLRQTKDIDSVVELYGLSEPQRKYLLLAQPGEGIIKMGNSLIPFNNPQPKDTKTYKLLTTKPGEME